MAAFTVGENGGARPAFQSGQSDAVRVPERLSGRIAPSVPAALSRFPALPHRPRWPRVQLHVVRLHVARAARRPQHIRTALGLSSGRDDTKMILVRVIVTLTRTGATMTDSEVRASA